MAVVMEKSMVVDLLEKFGVDPKFVSYVTSGIVGIIPSVPGQFMFKNNETGAQSTVMIKSSAMTLAKQGTLGPVSKKAFQFELEKAIKTSMPSGVVINAGAEAQALADEEAANGVAVKNLSALAEDWPVDDDLSKPAKTMPNGGSLGSVFAKQEQAAAKAAMKKAKGAANVIIGEKKVFKNPVMLADATDCYQPVFGTSSGSVYYVVAMFNGMNLAARIKHNTMSLRAAGENLSTYMLELTDLGFAKNAGYASIHLNVGADASLILKTVGAVVGRIGFQNIKQVANISEVIGK